MNVTKAHKVRVPLVSLVVESSCPTGESCLPSGERRHDGERDIFVFFVFSRFYREHTNASANFLFENSTLSGILVDDKHSICSLVTETFVFFVYWCYTCR